LAAAVRGVTSASGKPAEEGRDIYILIYLIKVFVILDDGACYVVL